MIVIRHCDGMSPGGGYDERGDQLWQHGAGCQWGRGPVVQSEHVTWHSHGYQLVQVWGYHSVPYLVSSPNLADLKHRDQQIDANRFLFSIELLLPDKFQLKLKLPASSVIEWKYEMDRRPYRFQIDLYTYFLVKNASNWTTKDSFEKFRIWGVQNCS